MTDTTDTDVAVRTAAPADRATVGRLWLMFRHDLSGFRRLLPRPDGTFRDERVEDAFSSPDWAPYLFVRGEHPVGFAFVRGLGAPVRVLNSFFVVRGARRTGIGLRAVHEVLTRHPGSWEVAFQYENPGAVAFWRRVAAQAAGDAWAEEPRPVPGRPELPPDVWISFGVRGRAPGAGRPD
ncbi:MULTISPECIES: GNAT family N-acetyltransferase [unclassified Streptomyces]|uniref:GNAT family N-acetyltransferase n=1 Tax=unclassified Streptomyces TaxID=2593676 RepID=UPI0037245405